MYTIKLKAVFVCMLACMLILAAACQPTPETQAVVNRMENPLDELVLEKAGPNDVWPQPQTIIWNETKTVDFDNDKRHEYTVAVSIDAQTPDDPGKVPVVLIEPEKLDIDFLTKAAKYLMPGEIYNGRASKQDVSAEILDFKKVIGEHNINDGYQSQVIDNLNRFNKDYEAAADSNNAAKFEFDDSGYLYLKSYSDGSGTMEFMGGELLLDFYRYEYNKAYMDIDNKRDESFQAKGIKTTFEQARATADEAMSAIFSEPFSMTHSNRLDKVVVWEPFWNDDGFTSLGQAYAFFYSRDYNGVSSLYIEPAPIVELEGIKYTVDYPREYVNVAVDDNGLVKLHCESFSKTVEIINDDVKLMPFDSILERFKLEVFYHSLWGLSKTNIKITRIDFGLVREPVKDNPDRYMMVPAWNFVGDISNDFANEQGVSIIALNAINGSVITNYSIIS